ncbi:MAG: DNA mismatch repair protein MutS, partial [Christensenellales bacterium]
MTKTAKESKKENSLSPMMKHYLLLKEKYSEDTVLLYRLGDFYEMFFDDAVTASRILDLTLTGRDCGLEERAPMCGVPYHAVDNYITRLINAGYKVAICEQLSNPGDQKGLVVRDVIRVITPGTNTNEEMLDGTVNHYLAGVARYKDDYSVALLDITTGEFSVKEFKNSDFDDLEDYLLSNAPSEIIAPDDICALSKNSDSVINMRLVKFTPFYDYSFDYDNAAAAICKHFGIFSVDAIGLADKKSAVCSAGAVIEYVLNTQKRNLAHISKLRVIEDSESMLIDYNTRKNLELTEAQSDGKKTGSLLWVLDRTKTSMGARLLRNWLLHPLTDVGDIEMRQTAIGELVRNNQTRNAIGNLLSKVRDIERLVTKISYFSIMPKDCKVLEESLKLIPSIKLALSKLKSPLICSLNDSLVPHETITDKLAAAITDADMLPATTKDGGYIKEGYDKELDELRKAKYGGGELIKEYEEKQREITGVSAIKVRYNRIFGYYIEIPNSKKPEILPENYIRRQTIANGERYVTEELMALEREILGASERILELENNLYSDLKEFLAGFASDLQKTAHILANVDCLFSLSEVAMTNGYVKPKFVAGNVLSITDGRHPVVERLLKKNEFVPNDAVLNSEASTLIITGPNMAGKSTYIRQVALLTLMAHIGSFVPAKKMELSIVDRIFTRVGASDNLLRGQSTFMVEMLEVANILNNATSKSLLILDEIGRGTSTLDGLSIAWAIVEHIVLKLKAKTLFATHYHELSELEGLLPRVRNYRILIQETPSGIVFL